MANCCFFELRVRCPAADADDLREFIHPEKYDTGLCAFLDNDSPVTSLEPDEKGRILLTYFGECKWSVFASLTDSSAMCYPSRNANYITLGQIASRPSVDLEIFAEESGFNFEEHYLYLDGKLVKQEQVDYERFEFEEGEYPNPAAFCEDFGLKDIDPNEFVLDEGQWVYRKGGIEQNWTL